MLIRSSDKMKIVPLERLDSLCVCEENGEISIRSFTETDRYGLKMGVYATKQRAIEALDEICNAYISLNTQDGRYCPSKYGYFGGYVRNGIYQMPEE